MLNGKFVQFGSTFILSLISLYIGFNVAWISYATMVLESHEATPIFGRPLTKYETSFIGSLPMIASAVGCICGGYVAETIGRKRSEILCAICCVLSATLTKTASNLAQLLVGRIVMGIASGFHLVIVFIFVNEISQESIRGALSSYLVFAYSSGILTSYICGWAFTYNTVNNMVLYYCVTTVVLLCFLKESPVYLLRRNKDKEALDSLRFYRRASRNTLTNELKYLKSLQATEDEIALDPLLPEEKLEVKKPNALEILRTSKAAQRALVIVTTNILLSISMGAICVFSYAGQFFMKAAPNISHHLCSVILALIVTVSSGLSAVVTDLMGRRVLMIGSCIISTICLALLGILLRWPVAPDWVTSVAILGFCCVYQLGANNIPLVQMAESFVPEVKALATTLILVLMSLGNFALLTIYRPTVDVIGLDGAFFVFSAVGLLTTIFTYFFMKETKGVGDDVIQDMYEQGYINRKAVVNKIDIEC